MTIHQTIVADPLRVPVVPPRTFLSFIARILGNGRDSGGLHLIEMLVASGDSSPWHVHHDEDEWFYVIDGELEVGVGDARVRLGAGDFAFGPIDVPHGYRVTSATPARFLMITVGANFSDFIAEMSEPAAAAVLPGPVEIDFAKVTACAAKYGMEILGPYPA
jgi:mannose-6-phosphate isomerase-like protein (cupin superfamily)